MHIQTHIDINKAYFPPTFTQEGGLEAIHTGKVCSSHHMSWNRNPKLAVRDVTYVRDNWIEQVRDIVLKS